MDANVQKHLVFSGNDYSKSVDYWSLGLLCHEIGKARKSNSRSQCCKEWICFCHLLEWSVIKGIWLINQEFPYLCLSKLMQWNCQKICKYFSKSLNMFSLFHPKCCCFRCFSPFVFSLFSRLSMFSQQPDKDHSYLTCPRGSGSTTLRIKGKTITKIENNIFLGQWTETLRKGD